MAVTYGFYDSLNHDRLYNAQQMSAIFDGIINDGVFMSVGNQFHTVAGTGMQVIVKSGRAWFDSTWTLNDAEYPLSIDAADVLLTRIDAVVLEVNSEVATRANTIKIVKGTPASTPAKPTLTNTATIHQHALAYVTVAKNITAITNSMIEIVVGKTETPYVTAILQTTDITDLYNQWEDYFQTWFDTVRGTLDGDVALNLQNQITTLRRDTLKNTTPPIIGLPSSATPDDMFQALGNTGELHVWRKTVVNSQPQDAYYSLGNIITTSGTIIDLSKQNVNQVGFKLSDSVMVLPDGSVSLVNLKMYYKYTYNSNMNEHRYVASDGTYIIDGNFSGKFISFYADSPSYYGSNYITLDKIYYIPATASCTYGAKLTISQLQPVIGHAAITAGTTTTHPVSTNPNAYQEGSDAKPAGYTLGEVVTGKYILGWVAPGNTDIKIDVSSALTVSDSGDVSMSNPSIGQSFNTATSDLLGKFIRANTYGITSSNTQGYQLPSGIIHIPSTATIKNEVIPSISSSSQWVTIDRYQPVTGYAAIPAGTTIEYLGKLGDKARVQVVSYVGTGTYEGDNQCSITAGFKIKAAIMMYHYMSSAGSIFMISDELSTDYTSGIGFSKDNANYSWGKKSADGKTLFWYGTRSANGQFNESGKTYYILCIG